MSSDIWTQCGAVSSVRRLRRSAWRVVEDQHVSSTFKLVDTVEEHDLLEALLDEAKPPPPDVEEGPGLHFLLYTPFRYPPLRHGSRFGRRFERGLWYGSVRIDTALAETAYYLFLFVEGTTADLLPLDLRRLAFPARIATSRGVDLTRNRFLEYADQLTHKSSYSATQELGTAMRDVGVEAILYTSARDPRQGLNLALFSPRAFASRDVPADQQQTWAVTVASEGVLFHRGLGKGSRRVHYSRDQFLVDGALPAPAC
jgi:hypothetical protein